MSLNARHLASLLGTLLEPASLLWQRLSGQGAILLYHRVSRESDPTYPPLSPEVFEQHCDFFQKYFTVVSLGEFLRKKAAGESLKKLVAFTFDDGYEDFLTSAYPAMKRRGIPSTHFLVSDCMNRGLPTWNLRLKLLGAQNGEADVLGKMSREERDRWLKQKENNKSAAFPPMIRQEQLRLVDPELVEWGSHTVSHALLPNLAAEEMRAELRDSKKLLEEWSHGRIRYFSYPKGACSADAAAAVRESGYEAAFVVGQGAVSAGSDLFTLPRFDLGALPRALVPGELSGLNSFLRRLR